MRTPEELHRGLLLLKLPFLLIVAPQCWSPLGFLMLFLSPPLHCLLDPPSSIQPISLVQGPTPPWHAGSFKIRAWLLTSWLLVDSPIYILGVLLTFQPFTLKPCLVFKIGPCSDVFLGCDSTSELTSSSESRPTGACFSNITDDNYFLPWFSFSNFLWCVFASASGRLTISRVGSHRSYPNSFLSVYSSLQLNTFCSYSWNLLFPLLFNYSGVFTWGPVASCSGVCACFTGSGVQLSRP